MPRFTSVQAYADNNANLRKLTYEQATGKAPASNSAQGESRKPLGGPVKTEKVVNPYGSAAGAGSGEFHVYRHARAREMKRWKELDKEQQQELLDKSFQQQLEEQQRQLEEATAKRRRKRQRQKEAKQRKKNLNAAGIDTSVTGSSNHNLQMTRNREEEDIAYIPVVKQEQEEGLIQADGASKVNDMFVANDESFLEKTKIELRKETTTGSVENPDGDDENGPNLPLERQNI